jgi:hypothetical protein
MSDWWTRERLRAVDYPAELIEWALSRASHTGHGGRPVIERDRLGDLLAEYERGEGDL